MGLQTSCGKPQNFQCRCPLGLGRFLANFHLVFDPTSVSFSFGVGLSTCFWFSLDSNRRVDRAGKRYFTSRSLLKRCWTHLGSERFWQLPTLFWLNAGDNFLQVICLLGAEASLMVIANFLRAGHYCPRGGFIFPFSLWLNLFKFSVRHSSS